MNGRDSIQSLLALRKLTRAITDAVRAQMTEYLTTLTPLLRPKALLGEYIQAAEGNDAQSREGVQGPAGPLRSDGADEAFQPAP